MTSVWKARARHERAPSASPVLFTRMMSRQHRYRAVLAVFVSLHALPIDAVQRASNPVPAVPQVPASAAAVLAGSEIAVVESGGIAGRIHSARFVAADGRIQVEYRAREVRGGAPAFTGTIDPERYVDLWRQFEAAGMWSVASAAPTRGADLIQVEVRLRLGDAVHVVRWDEGNEQTKEVRELGEIGRRALTLGRDASFAR